MPTSIHLRRKSAALAALLLCFAPVLSAQEAPSDLELESYEIIGKDTSKFTPSGERLSTVTYTPAPLPLPVEGRPAQAVGGLFPGNSDLRRSDGPEAVEGLFAAIDAIIGSRTAADLGAGVSYGEGNHSGTVRFFSRSRKENTPSNQAPSSQGFEGTGYLDTPYGNFALDLGMLHEGENALSDRFRHRDRKMSHYSAGLRMLAEPLSGWNIRAGGAIGGGSFRDRELDFDHSEFRLNGRASLEGEIEGVELTVSTEADHSRFGSESGSLFSLGASGAWIPDEGVTLRGGLRFYASAMPDDDAEARLYPELALDWMFAPDMYLHLEGKSRVIRRSFTDLYRLNGLLTADTPLLDEDRKFDLTAEYGIRIYPDLLFTAGLFAWQSENAPVFSRTGSFFRIVPNARVTVSGLRIGAEYDGEGIWGADGALNLRNASWNHDGEVPYLPTADLEVNAHLVPRRPWTLYSSLRFQGKHHVEQGSDDTAKAFLTLDVGGERPVYTERVSACLEIRNLLNSSGAWWTGEYRMPGIGLYAGLKARY